MPAGDGGSIAFASFFLGLVTGTVPVTVLVNPPVAVVEFRLDGAPVARRATPPWTAEIPLGDDFVPHELVAAALDVAGSEIGRARQWINLPRPAAEVEILPERDPGGRVVAARLSWQSLLGPSPTGVRVTFDGRTLSRSGDRVAIPEFDPHATHVLSAELEFPMHIRSRQDLVLGGGSSGDARSELTAVPVRVRSGKLPPAAGLAGWFRRNGELLAVAAVEHGPADVIVVREPTTEEAARRLSLPMVGGRFPAGSRRTDMALSSGDRSQIVWPTARSYPMAAGGESVAELFERSQPYGSKDAGVYWLLTHVYNPSADGSPRRFADAVAVAGLQAFSGYSRRAVVLLRGHGADASRSPAGAVRRYLGRIRVPLHVWSLAGKTGEDPDWGSMEDVSSYWKLDHAVRLLKEDLEQQWIVWVEGRHLPQEIELTERAAGIEMVR